MPQLVDPRLPPTLVPPGSTPRIYNAVNEQGEKQYLDAPSITTPNGTVILRWSFTDEERAALFRGEDVYLAVMTFNKPLQPVAVVVGLADWTEY